MSEETLQVALGHATTDRVGREGVLGAFVCGVEPHAFLGEAARRAIRNPGTVTLPRDLE